MKTMLLTYVTTEPCIGIKDARCTISPRVDRIHSTPDEPASRSLSGSRSTLRKCIDCDACVEACPVDAITSEDQVPPHWQHYIAKDGASYKKRQP
jgi:ferredoxin